MPCLDDASTDGIHDAERRVRHIEMVVTSAGIDEQPLPDLHGSTGRSHPMATNDQVEIVADIHKYMGVLCSGG